VIIYLNIDVSMTVKGKRSVGSHDIDTDVFFYFIFYLRAVSNQIFSRAWVLNCEVLLRRVCEKTML
jgi:hypothetical protein